MEAETIPLTSAITHTEGRSPALYSESDLDQNPTKIFSGNFYGLTLEKILDIPGNLGSPAVPAWSFLPVAWFLSDWYFTFP